MNAGRPRSSYLLRKSTATTTESKALRSDRAAGQVLGSAHTSTICRLSRVQAAEGRKCEAKSRSTHHASSPTAERRNQALNTQRHRMKAVHWPAKFLKKTTMISRVPLRSRSRKASASPPSSTLCPNSRTKLTWKSTQRCQQQQPRTCPAPLYRRHSFARSES
jgi:hypothetical protein